MFVLLNILIFAGVLILTLLASFAICTLYINSKNRVSPKYHYTSPVEEKSLKRDFDLTPNNQTGVDGDNALKGFIKG